MNTIRSSDQASGSGVRTRASRGARGAAILLAALVWALLAAPSGCGRAPGPEGGDGAAASRGKEGSPAPHFTLPDLEGNKVASSDFAGKVVILDFWATWCPPCKEEVPHFVRLQSKYRDQGLVIVGLSLDGGGAKDVKPFAEEYNVNYTMLIANDEIAKAYGGVTMIPTTFVLDRSGTIVKRFIGLIPPEVFEETIRPLLAAS
jgi:cytochrome c biogenesis protein CcmG/thiol:disulfide interchange protein DsbE